MNVRGINLVSIGNKKIIDSLPNKNCSSLRNKLIMASLRFYLLIIGFLQSMIRQKYFVVFTNIFSELLIVHVIILFLITQ